MVLKKSMKIIGKKRMGKCKMLTYLKRVDKNSRPCYPSGRRTNKHQYSIISHTLKENRSLVKCILLSYIKLKEVKQWQELKFHNMRFLKLIQTN